MNKKIILNCLKNHLQEFKEKYNVEKIGLFGSYARDEATEESDIDIFVKMPPKMFDMIAIKNLIEEELGKKVDIIREHKHIKPLLLKRINRDIIYVKDMDKKMGNKTYFGINIFEDDLVKEDDIKKLPFYDFFTESMKGSTYLEKDGINYILNFRT